MSAIAKIKAYAIANGKTIADLEAMGKQAVVDAAGLTRLEAWTIFKAYKRYQREQDKEATDANTGVIAWVMRYIATGPNVVVTVP